MGRPRKILVHAPADLSDSDSRGRYINDLRKRVKLFDAKEAAALLGISQDRLYKLPIPRFEPSPRRSRWDGHSLADFLEKGMGTRASLAQYLAVVSGARPMTATTVADILGLHSDAVPFLGLETEDHSLRGRTIYQPGSLARWLEQRQVLAEVP